ncbi:methionyl-tRNA formyltransferase [Candidatus Dojkabacteria bacterium]|uniref:Methionyl-tRNA formyltransferase n=1 Tax=Candidatus Dojkabacteria bacterium TaxID=2099670 RepID=A0A955L8X4_9BACT|nr:methionyl-tRNA formyltransferase [Candidatus Dojkabacteria bacterium]
MQAKRVIFIGTSEFGIPSIERLSQMEEVELVCVVTQPDRPVGRKQVLQAPPVKEWVQNYLPNIPIEQPEKITLAAKELLERYKPDCIIVASYGQFIPTSILEVPEFKCLNIHASLLPDLRGAVPMPMAIWKGYKQTGTTIQIMEEGMDQGSIIGSKVVTIDERETTATLTEKLSEISGVLLEEVLPLWFQGKIVPKKQDDSEATYCYQKDIAKPHVQINWDLSAKEIDCMIRALVPWPIAWIEITENQTNNKKFWGKRLKVFEASLREDESNHTVGEFYNSGDSLCVQTGNGALELVSIQLEGKKRMSGKDYLFLIT